MKNLELSPNQIHNPPKKKTLKRKKKRKEKKKLHMYESNNMKSKAKLHWKTKKLATHQISIDLVIGRG